MLETKSKVSLVNDNLTFIDHAKNSFSWTTQKAASCGRAVGRGLLKGATSTLGIFAFMFVALAMLAKSAHAAPVTIPLTNIELDWTSFATQLGTSLAAVIAVAIGVGIGVWMVRLVYTMFKSFARG